MVCVAHRAAKWMTSKGKKRRFETFILVLVLKSESQPLYTFCLNKALQGNHSERIGKAQIHASCYNRHIFHDMTLMERKMLK